MRTRKWEKKGNGTKKKRKAVPIASNLLKIPSMQRRNFNLGRELSPYHVEATCMTTVLNTTPGASNGFQMPPLKPLIMYKVRCRCTHRPLFSMTRVHPNRILHYLPRIKTNQWSRWLEKIQVRDNNATMMLVPGLFYNG